MILIKGKISSLDTKCKLLYYKWQPTPVLLPGKSHGWKSLVGYSPWGRKELAITERLHLHSSIQV